MHELTYKRKFSSPNKCLFGCSKCLFRAISTAHSSRHTVACGLFCFVKTHCRTLFILSRKYLRIHRILKDCLCTHLTIFAVLVLQLENLASEITVNSYLTDWRRFLLAAAQPWPVPSVAQLLQTLHGFKSLDVTGSGFVTLEHYLQVISLLIFQSNFNLLNSLN